MVSLTALQPRRWSTRSSGRSPSRARLDGSELWVHELIGSLVTDTSGRPCGTCVAVLANPAHDLLELDNGDLVPVVFVVQSAEGVIVIDPPEGLLTT